LLYSADLRAHGRKSARFEALIIDPPQGVDVLVLEGTHVRAQGARERPRLSEADVEDRCAEFFRETRGMVLASYSGQNIDRMVSLYRAAKRAGRTLVLDLYGATIATATGRWTTIPQANWRDVAVYVPRNQRMRVKLSGEFQRMNAIYADRIFPEQLVARASTLVLTFRGSMTRELEAADCLNGARAVWSLWPGYLECPSGHKLRRWLERHEIPLSFIHASGHATVPDLQRLARGIDAGRVVPMHTSAPERFPELFDRAELHRDGEWWKV
jgi:ribonuclease J